MGNGESEQFQISNITSNSESDDPTGPTGKQASLSVEVELISVDVLFKPILTRVL